MHSSSVFFVSTDLARVSPSPWLVFSTERKYLILMKSSSSIYLFWIVLLIPSGNFSPSFSSWRLASMLSSESFILSCFTQKFTILFFFFSRICSIWKFLGQGLNLSCSFNPLLWEGANLISAETQATAVSFLAHYATVGTLAKVFLKKLYGHSGLVASLL